MIYNVDDYVKCQIKVFSEIHKSVKDKLRSTSTKATVCNQQHKRAFPISLEVCDSVMIRVSERESKLSSKLMGPLLVTQHLGGHKFEVWDPCPRSSEIVHADRLKRTSAELEEGEPSPVENSETGTTPGLA